MFYASSGSKQGKTPECVVLKKPCLWQGFFIGEQQRELRHQKAGSENRLETIEWIEPCCLAARTPTVRRTVRERLLGEGGAQHVAGQGAGTC